MRHCACTSSARSASARSASARSASARSETEILEGLANSRRIRLLTENNKVTGTCPKNSNLFEFVGLVAESKVGPCDKILKQK